jgi:hypothetical protein
MDTPALNFDDPKTQGILALAAGLMQASGPSRYPVGLGQVLGTGIQQGLGAYQQARKSNLDMQLEEQKIKAAQQQAAMNDQLAPMLSNPKGFSPEVIEAVGMRAGMTGHPGAATLLKIAEGMRQKQENTKQLGMMKSGDGYGGLFGNLADSPYVGGEAKALQARLDQMEAGNPAEMMKHYERLRDTHFKAKEGEDRRDNSPKTRLRISGNDQIQEEWDSKTKTWQKIGEGPRFASMAGVGSLNDEALTLAADQYLAGDSSAAQGYARNAATKAALQNKIAERAKAQGMGGADIAARVAEFQGMKAGQRTLGTRTAQIEMAVTEAQNIIPIALATSEKVDRTKYPTLNSILQAAQKGTGDENVVRLASATNALINVYSRAISPTGTPTVSDKDHAREIIDKAYSQGQYKAVIDLMQQEMAAARKSPGQVRDAMRGGITGKEPAPAAPAAGWNDDKERRYQELLRKRGS